MNYTFYGLRQLAQLHLESNNIRRLEGHEFLSLRGNDRSSAQRYDHRNNIITAKHGSLTHLVREPMAPPETRSVCLLIVIMRLFSGLRELYLHRNLIDYIEFETFGHLESLEVLTLAHNRLFRFPGHFSLVSSPYLVELSLASNPWSCDCDHVTQFRSGMVPTTNFATFCTFLRPRLNFMFDATLRM